MAERVGSEKIVRMPGHLYYVGGNGKVYSAKIGHKGSKQEVSKTAVPRVKGYLYYVDKQGFVSRTPMKHGRSKHMREKG
jgi:hypothetical protein